VENGRVGACWQSKHAYATDGMDLSITKTDSSILVSILHTGRASKSSLFAARKYTLSNVKIGTSTGVAVAQTEGSRKCNLRVARTQIAELTFVSTAVPVLRRVAPKNHVAM